MNIYISSMYLSRRHELLLKTLLSAATLDNKDVAWTYADVLDDNCTQAALIVDIDNKEGKQYWSDSVGRRTMPLVVAYTSVNGFNSEHPVVYKPLRLQELIAILSRVAQATPATRAKPSETLSETVADNTAAVTPATRSHDNTAATYAPAVSKRREEVVLQRLLSKRQSCFQITYSDQKILVSPSYNLYYGDADLLAVTDALLQPLSRVDIQELTSANGHIARSGTSVKDLGPVLWHSIVQYSHGPLFDVIQDSIPFKLSRWPDYKFLMQNASFMKLAAIISKRWSTLQTLTQETSLPQQDIMSFVNACYGLRYLSIDKTQQLASHSRPVALTIATKRQSLFSKIRSRLGI